MKNTIKSYHEDSWINNVTKLFGFQSEKLDQHNFDTRKGQKGRGLFIIKNTTQSVFVNAHHQKKIQLKSRWKELMRFPSKSKQVQIIELLKEGSACQDESWIWLLKNNQKISGNLFNLRRQKLKKILFGHLSQREFFSNQPNIQNLENTDYIYKTKQMQPYSFNLNNNQLKKDKISISKSTNNTNKNISTTRTSQISQSSTFSTQTQASKQLSCLNNESFCPYFITNEQPYTSKTSNFSNSDSIYIYQNVGYQPPATYQSLHNLPSKISNTALMETVGAFLLHREDIPYSLTLFNMASTFFYYANSSQIKTFVLLNHICTSEFYVHYLSKDPKMIKNCLSYIDQKVKKNCPSTVFLRNLNLEYFIQSWLQNFFFTICENGSEIKEKLISYLLIYNFSVDSLANFSQSLVKSLSRIINQGREDKTIECLTNPKFFIDKQIFFENLLRTQRQ